MTAFTIGQTNGVDSNVRLRAVLSSLVAGAAGTLKSRTGMLGNGLATTRTTGMGLAVSAGRLWVAGSVDLQFGYPVIFDAPTALTLEDGSSSARVDIVCAQVRDNPFDGSGATGPRIFVVKGSAGGGVPATPTGAVKLAEQPVPANVSAGTGGLTTDPVDKRPPRTAMQGGIVGVVDRDDANGNLSLYDGLKVFRRDTGTFESRVGGAWVTDPSPASIAAMLAATTPGAVNFASGWANFGSGYANVSYYRDALGIVHLAGLAKGTATGQILVLDGGFRPAATEVFDVITNPATLGRINIGATGSVELVAGSPAYVSLSGITFRAAAG